MPGCPYNYGDSLTPEDACKNIKINRNLIISFLFLTTMNYSLSAGAVNFYASKGTKNFLIVRV